MTDHVSFTSYLQSVEVVSERSLTKSQTSLICTISYNVIVGFYGLVHFMEILLTYFT